MLREFGLGHAEDTVGLLHVWSTVTGVVHLQTVVQLIQVFLYITNLLLRHMVQAKSYLHIPHQQSNIAMQTPQKKTLNKGNDCTDVR